MDNLSDYILWMGDYPISLTGFHEPDVVILCLLSYIDFRPAFTAERRSIPLKDTLPILQGNGLRVMITGDSKEHEKIYETAAKSKRFGELILSDYVDLLDDSPTVQFSAVCFHGSDWSFIAYRGTDSSVTGWKEDFMISFTKTEAQELALNYAKDHLTDDRIWYMGGHSKGGNEVLYASAMLPEETLNKVRHIYLLDGPGLCPEVTDVDITRRIDGKATRIIPEFSIVGKLFEPEISDTRIVQSSAMGIEQHGLATWAIDHGKLAYAEENDSVSEWLCESLNEWIGTIPQDDRPVFVEEFFDAISAGGTTDLNMLRQGSWSDIDAILKRIDASSELTKKVLTELPRRAFQNALDQVRQKIEETAASRKKAKSDNATDEVSC